MNKIVPKIAPSNWETEVDTQKTENRPTYADFDFRGVGSPTSPTFKTHKKFVLHNRTYIACNVYT